MKKAIGDNEKITCLAIDLGGTKILVGEVDESGNVLRSKKYKSAIDNQKLALDSIIAAIDDYMKNVGLISSKVVSIGVGLIGRVDNAKGIWLQIDPGRSMTMPVASIISERYKLPCAIDNDVRCAASAEKKLGFGKKSRNFIYINIGTGIAAGFVVNGELIIGSSFNAGEVGHHVVFKDSNIQCECGRVGCVEAIASGMGMDRRARNLKNKFSTSSLNISDDRRCDVYEIFRLADKGDALCKLLVDDAVDAISATIMNLVRVCDPDTVILGGGLVTDGWLLKKINEKLNSSTMRFVKNGIVLTELDPNNIGLIGASVVGLQPFVEERKNYEDNYCQE